MNQSTIKAVQESLDAQCAVANAASKVRQARRQYEDAQREQDEAQNRLSRAVAAMVAALREDDSVSACLSPVAPFSAGATAEATPNPMATEGPVQC